MFDVRCVVPTVLIVLAAAVVAPAHAEKKPHPGYVDGTRLIDLVGDDAVRVEVSMGQSLIKLVASADPDLERLVGGLHSIYALILDLGDDAKGTAVKKIRQIERDLVAEGWERLARVKEDDAEIKVLILNDEESISGLVLLMVEADDDEPALVFVNVAGMVDLAAIREIGQGFGVPGLRDIELDDR